MYSSSYSTHLSALSTPSQPKSYICVHIWAVPAAALSSWGDWWCLFWCLDLKLALHQTQCVHAEKKKKRNHMNNFHMGWSKQQLCLFLCLFISLCTFQKNSLTSLLGKGEKLDSSANLYLSSVGSQPNSCASPPIFIILMGGCAGVAPASLLGGIWVEKSITVEGERCGQLTQAVMILYRRWSETFWVKVLMVAHRCLFKKIFLNQLMRYKNEKLSSRCIPPPPPASSSTPPTSPQIASSWVH